MARFTLEVNLDDAALADPGSGPSELRRLLSQVGNEAPDAIYDDDTATTTRIVRDANGNTVGAWKYEGDE